jgi:hypothetical protein
MRNTKQLIYLGGFTRAALLVLLAFICAPEGAAAHKCQGEKKKKAAKPTPSPAGELIVKVKPWGVTQRESDALAARITATGRAGRDLNGSNYRRLAFEHLDRSGKNGESLPPLKYRAIYYNYTRNHAVTVIGNIDGGGEPEVTITNDQPTPSPEEYDAAVAVLLADDYFGPAIRAGELRPGRAMPPLVYPANPGETVERALHVQLLAPGGKSEYGTEIVAVNLVRNKIERYQDGGPPTSLAAPQTCGIPNAGQGASSGGAAGRFQFTVSQNNVTLWEFVAIRPAASSGDPFERSGIELRDVKYKGKLALKRIHTPILNVNYDNHVCGPYRDWQYQEGMFQANGADVADGARDCGVNIPATVLDTGNDNGNFRGLAFYRRGREVVLVSEMEAGWSRHVIEYRLANDGAIRPRYGYRTTDNSCACVPHWRHVYWRFDFDVDGANNVVMPSRREFEWGRPLTNEQRAHRSPTAQTNWIVQNPNTLSAYMIRPNGNDGNAAAGSYGRGDLWFLKYRDTEITDTACAGESGSAAKLNCYLNNESLSGDIVVWYAGHFSHNDAANVNPNLTGPDILNGSRVQGPDLIPARW